MTEPDEPAPPQHLPRGCRLALDVGTVRIGVARSDPDGILATPFDTVRREEKADVRRIATIVAEEQAAVVYVGLPRTLRGGDSSSTELARAVAQQLADAVHPVPVHLVDERLSTVDASRMMRDSGRRAKEQRAAIDSAAAVVILQTALDRERASVTRAGVPVRAAQWARTPRPVPSARPGPPPSARALPGAAPHRASPGQPDRAEASGSVSTAPTPDGQPERPRKPRHRRGQS